MSEITLTNEIKRKIGALFMVGIPQDGVTKEYEEICEKYLIGNFCVNANHTTSIENLCRVTSRLRRLGKTTQNEYPFIGIDQEGGWVTRFYEGAGMISGAMSYAAMGATHEKMFGVGEKLGRILRALGCNVNNAPSLDINLNPNNPIIGTRSYGDNKEQVSRLGVSFAKGLEKSGVISACKHFPGHGNVHGDTHIEAVVNDSSQEFLSENDFATFKEAIDEGVGALMTAHVTFPALSMEPATVSYEIMTKLLREQMGFEGVVITDAMEMNAVRKHYQNGEGYVKAIEAGCDQILIYTYYEERVKEAFEAVYEAVKSGRITEKRLDESIERIERQKIKYNISSAEPDIELAEKLVFSQKDIAEIYEDKVKSITCIKNDGILSELKDKKTLCIAPDWQLRRGVEEAKTGVLSFAETFGKVFENAVIQKLSPENAVPFEGDYDVAVVGIFNFASSPEQAEVLNFLKQKGIPVAAVLLNSPYEYKYVSGCNGVVTCYEYTELSVRALVEAMKNGRYEGNIPVKLSN